jgi:hypothetical protein
MTLSKIEAWFGKIAHAIVKGAGDADKVAAKIQEAAPIVEGVTTAVFPTAEPVEALAFGILGKAAAAAQATGAAAGADGLNLTLDAETVAEIKALAAEIEAAAKSANVAKPKA